MELQTLLDLMDEIATVWPDLQLKAEVGRAQARVMMVQADSDDGDLGRANSRRIRDLIFERGLDRLGDALGPAGLVAGNMDADSPTVRVEISLRFGTAQTSRRCSWRGSRRQRRTRV